MPSLREIRLKIKSVKSTEQITKAMKMVAAARMRRAQASILSARPFAAEMSKLVCGLSAMAKAQIAQDEVQVLHPFFDAARKGAPALILVTADKGLCGSFNANLIKAAVEWLKAHRGQKIYLAVVGRKGRDFLQRLQGFDIDVFCELLGIFPKANFSHAEILGKAVMDVYEKGQVSSVTVIYNEFKSVAQQKLLRAALLPIEPEAPRPADLLDCGFEPEKDKLLDALLRRSLKAQIYRILLESQAAELSARMNAMDAASKNAAELKASLNLEMNSQRQAIITKEIAELVGGAEALAV